MMHYLWYRLVKPIGKHKIITVWLFIVSSMLHLLGMWYFEWGKSITTVTDLIYWLAVTITTVGFGEITPVTQAGKTLFIFLAPVNIVLAATVLGLLVTSIIGMLTKSTQGDGTYRGQDHLILVGWTEVTKELLKLLPKKMEIVLIVPHDVRWDDLDDPQLRDQKIDYLIRGDSITSETLQRAGIHRAQTLVIDNIQDGHTWLTTQTSRRICRNENTRLRILSVTDQTQHIDNLKRAGADVVVCPVRRTLQATEDMLDETLGTGHVVVIGEGSEYRQLVCELLGDLTKYTVEPFTGDATSDEDIRQIVQRENNPPQMAILDMQDDAKAALCIGILHHHAPKLAILAIAHIPDDVPDFINAGDRQVQVICPPTITALEIAHNRIEGD